MKTVLLLILLSILCQNSFCQEKKLIIENHATNKTITVKENKRIKVITTTGEKFAGRFMVLDKNSIAVDGVVLDLNEIDSIRKRSLIGTILVKANFIHMGVVAFLVTLIPGSFPIILAGVAILAGGVYGAIKLPVHSKTYTAENKWVFKIEGLPETKVTIGIKPIEQFLFTNNRIPIP